MSWSGAAPFDPRRDKPRDNGDGSFSTEIATTNDAPDGGYWNIPTLWWRDGKPMELTPEGAQSLAMRYEQATGNKFPRFKSVAEAEASAQARSAGGGASASPLALPPPTLKPTTPDLPLASVGEGLSAAFATANRNSNVFNEFDGRVKDDLTGTTLEVVKRLGPDAVKAALAEQGLMPVVDEPLDETFFRYSDKARDAVLKMGADAATMSPEQWKDLDLTRDGAEARVTDAQKREAQEQAQIIAMSPYPTTASVIGGIASAVVDPRQWPLMLINPGGSFLKTVGWQAGLSVLGEAITLPSQMDTAARLGEPAPNVLAQLGMAAAGGGILGAAFEGVVRLPGVMRGIALQMERSKPVPGVTRPHVETAIAAAEDAIVRDAPIEPAIRSALPPEEPPPPDYAARFREDTTTDWEAVLREAQSRADEPQLSTAPNGPDAPPAPLPRAEQRATIAADLDRVEADLKKTAKWFSRYIKKRGGIHPESPIADELRNAGITHKTMPGLFSRKGARDLDNLDFASNDDAIAAIGTDGFYLNRQGVVDGLITELSGGRIKTPRDTILAAEADSLRAALRDLDMEDRIDAVAGPDLLTARERVYVKGKVAEGQDPKDAIHDVIARQIDDAEAPEVPNDVYEREINWEPFGDAGPGDTGATGSGGAVGPDQGANAAGAGPAVTGADFSVETTPAGDQTLIPGTEVRARDTSRDKALADLQAKQSKMRRLDQVDPDGMFAPKQMSIFDDPTSPQAAAEVDAQVAELRASLDPENPVKMQIEADDGRVLETDQDVVREIDEMDQLEREFAACLMGGVNVGA